MGEQHEETLQQPGARIEIPIGKPRLQAALSATPALVHHWSATASLVNMWTREDCLDEGAMLGRGVPIRKR